MGYVLIGKDCSVSICFGAVVPATQTFPSQTTVKRFAKSISLNASVDTIDTSALCDNLEKMRPNRTRFEIELSLLVLDTGAIAYQKEGFGIKIEVKELSTLSTAKTYVGMVEKVSIEIADGEATTEKISVVGGIDGYAYTGVYEQ